MPKSAPSFTRRQMRDFDRRAVEQWGVPSIVLMENAGRGSAEAVKKFCPPGGKVAVVAGGGNNGGDGFVIARHLHLRGLVVAVFVVGDAARATPDSAVNLAILRKLNMDIRLRAGEALARLADELRHFDVIVDALGGTGVAGPLRGDVLTAVEQVNAAARPVVAVDIPTGLDCDTGQAHGPAIKARLTVTMATRKVGFDAPGAKAYTGRVVVVDIGVPLE